MIEIYLDGILGQHCVPSFSAEVATIREAICAIKANFPAFSELVNQLSNAGVRFCIRAGYEEIGEEQLASPLNKEIRSIRLTAIPQGSGGGFGKIILGAALLGFGIFSGGIGFLGLSATSTMLLGGAILLQGVMALFGGQKDPQSDANDGKTSLIIGSASQTFKEGSRVPRLYGRTKVGLLPISVRYRSYKLA